MDNLNDDPVIDSCVALVKEGVQAAVDGNLEVALSIDVLKALACLQSNPETFGLYFTLLNEIVAAHESIKQCQIEKAIRKTQGNAGNSTDLASGADEIVAMVLEVCELFIDQEGQPYATIEREGHREVWPLNSSTFREWVGLCRYRIKGKPPRSAVMADALSTLNGIAKHDGEKRTVFLRVATDGAGGYFLDIGDDHWRVIHIRTSGWRLLNQSPVMFRRTKSSKAIPIPVDGGSLEDLKSLVNVDTKDDLLLISVLIDFLRPDTAYPVVELIGEQGSGKSTTADNMRRLIDPSAVNLRNAPKSTEDIFVGARNNHVVCFNNLSRLSSDEQDAFCNLSTGGGYASRKLYTNEEEVTYEAKRPVILNGINPVATRPDLVSRLVRLESPPLEDTRKRLSDQKLTEVFHRRGSRALGFLLDTMVSALAELPNVELLHPPRLMDFAKLGAAVGRVVNPKEGEIVFNIRYQESRDEASFQALESMPVIMALIEYLEVHETFTGNFAALLKVIESKIGKPTGGVWPKSGRGLSDAIKRAKPTLNRLGWVIIVARRSKHGANVNIKRNVSSNLTGSLDKSSTMGTTNINLCGGARSVGGVGQFAKVSPYDDRGDCSVANTRQAIPSGAKG